MVAGLPHGWFVPVSPGTRQVTIGGAIAADVHGKNHHVAGSFAGHVRSFDLLLPGGDLRTVTPADELFWATAGGMGLTGFIVRATVQLKRVGTSRIKVDTVRTADIDETMAVLAEHDLRYGYTVAWSDSLARGRGLGRSIITSGDFAEPADLTDRADRKRRPVRLRSAGQARCAARVPARADQPVHGPVRQRGLVPEGAPRPAGRAADDRPVLPPARRDQELEPGLRPWRLPPVPVRRAVRRGKRGPPVVRAGQPPRRRRS